VGRASPLMVVLQWRWRVVSIGFCKRKTIRSGKLEEKGDAKNSNFQYILHANHVLYVFNNHLIQGTNMYAMNSLG